MSQLLTNTPQTPPEPDRRPNRLPLLIGLGAIVIAVIGFALWTFLSGDAPEAVDLDAATAELADAGAGDAATQDEASADPEPAADDGYGGAMEGDSTDTESADAVADSTSDAPAAEATVTDVSGNWTVDTSIGEFSFENSTGTYVGFRVGEELSNIGETEAVGRTPNVSGTITIDGQTVTAAAFEADMTAITTDISRRDGAARRALDTDTFPTASFVLTEPIDLGTDPASGAPVTATASGNLSVHGVTNPVEVALEAQLVGDTIAVVGTTDVVFADYGVTPPSAPVVVRLDDFGVIEFQLFLTKA